MPIWLIPCLAALATAVELLLSKYVLTRRQLSLRDFLPLSFLMLCLFSAILTPWLGWVNFAKLLEWDGLALFVLIMASAISWNALFYRAIKGQKMIDSETVIVLLPLVTLLLAWAIYPTSFEVRVAASTVVATVALLWAYWRRHQLQFSRQTGRMFVAVSLLAVENLAVAEALQQQLFSPIFLYTIRTLLTAAIFYAYFRPRTRQISHVNLAWLGLVSLIGFVSMALRFYGLRDAGVIITAIMFALTPVIVYAVSYWSFHERLRSRQIAATVILILCVVYATLSAT